MFHDICLLLFIPPPFFFFCQHSGQSDQSLGKVDQETDAKIEEIRAAANDKKQDAIDKMMKAIINVETKPHENYRV